MGNEKLVLQANDIAALADRLIIRNSSCFLPKALLISTLLENKSFLSFFAY